MPDSSASCKSGTEIKRIADAGTSPVRSGTEIRIPSPVPDRDVEYHHADAQLC